MPKQPGVKAKVAAGGGGAPLAATTTTNNEATAVKQTAPLEPPPYLVYRSKDELKLLKPFEGDSVSMEAIVLAKNEDKNNRVEAICCSEDGELLAWCDSNVIKCIKFDTREVVFEQKNDTKSNCIMISPRSTKLVTYSTMSNGDNLHFWDIAEQKLLLSISLKKASQWKPLFSMLEDLCVQKANGELNFYPNCRFDKPKKISHLKVDDFSLSTASESNHSYQHIYGKRVKNKNNYMAIYSAGTKGQPSIVKIYKHPNMTDCVTNKSFFKADSVKFSWSPSGNSLLLTCQSDFDKSGKSYYGEQTLNFLSVKGDSYFVKLPKEGPISHISWQPAYDQDMFVCVYGFMPAKVTLFNNKCEIVCNFGDQGSFNAVTFSPFANLLAVYGFGNLAGQLCIWDVDKKKLLTTVKVPESTGIEWCADGKHILTRTTSPRLRVNNGFRLWHYTGSLIYEKISQSEDNLELYDLVWQPRPEKFRKPKVDSKGPKQPNLLSESKLGKFQSSSAKYVPPSARGDPSSILDSKPNIKPPAAKNKSNNNNNNKPKPKQAPQN